MDYLGRRQTSSESLSFQSQRWGDDFSAWSTIMISPRMVQHSSQKVEVVSSLEEPHLCASLSILLFSCKIIQGHSETQ